MRNYDLTHNHIAYLAILFAFTHAFAMLFPFRMWDDWAVYASHTQDVQRHYADFGHAYSYPLIWAISRLDDPEFRLVAPVVTVGKYLAAWIMLYIFLSRTRYMAQHALPIAMLSMCMPLNFAKPLTTMVSYGFALPFFMLGLLLLQSWLRDTEYRLRLLGSIVFFSAALLTPSFGPLYYCLLAFMVWEKFDCQGSFGLSASRAFLQRNFGAFLILLLLPIVILFVRSQLFPVSEAFASYNKITLTGIFLGFARVPAWLLQTAQDFVLLAQFPMWSISLTIVFYFMIRKSKFNLAFSPNKRTSLVMLLWSLIFTLSAVHPYLAVDKTPRYLDWDHRQQLVLQVAFGMFVFWLIAVAGGGVRAMRFMIALLCGITTTTYLAHHRDGHLQNAIVEAIRSSSKVREARSIAIDDGVATYRALGRRVRAYEWSGLAKEAFSNDGRFVDAIRVREPAADLSRFIFEPCGTIGPGSRWNNYSGWRSDGAVLKIRLAVRSEIGLGEAAFLTVVRLAAPTFYASTLENRIELTPISVSFPVAQCAEG